MSDADCTPDVRTAVAQWHTARLVAHTLARAATEPITCHHAFPGTAALTADMAHTCGRCGGDRRNPTPEHDAIIADARARTAARIAQWEATR